MAEGKLMNEWMKGISYLIFKHVWEVW
jgi:hypothetical protein